MTTLGDIPMSEVMNTEDVVHYGVKGMHWGIRKDRQSSSSSRGSGRNQIRNMSDQDLQKVVSRMRLEQQYRDMTTSKAVKTGRKQVAKYTNQAINLVMTTAISATVGAYIKQGFETGNWPTPSMPTDLNQVPGLRRSWV